MKSRISKKTKCRWRSGLKVHGLCGRCDLSSNFQGIGLIFSFTSLEILFLENLRLLSTVLSPKRLMSENHLNGNKKALGLSFLFIGIFYFSITGASTLNRFELVDGSVIQGEILSYSRGVYRINSDVLGTISLPEEKIRAIKPARKSGSQVNNSNGPNEPNSGAQKIDQMQDRMLKDPETVRLIEELKNNPSVQTILQDEDLMKAIAQGNLNRVGEDPKIKALMNDKTIEKIIEKNQ